MTSKNFKSDVSLDGDRTNLNRSSIRGGAITFVSQIVVVLSRMVSLVVLSRLLSPEDFGLIAMVLAVTTFASTFRDLGLSSATVQRAKLSHAQLSTLYWINVAVGIFLTVFTAASAPAVAWFYGRSELVPVTIALSCSFFLESLGTQPGALLTRQMRFGRHSIATICGVLGNLLTAVSLSLLGFTYWSLVVGSLVEVMVRSSLMGLLAGWRPGAPVRKSGVREMLGFGANVTAFNFINYFSRNLDNILIGRMWGAVQLGNYSRAYQLLMFPINNLRRPIERVAFPALSRLQDTPDLYRDYYRSVVFVLAIISMPLAAFLFLDSHAVISIVLGPQWLEVVPIFSILALVAFVQPCISTIGVVLMSLGKGREYLMLGIYCSVSYVVGFIIGVHWAPVGVATAYAIATYLCVIPLTAVAFRATPVGFSDFVSAVRNPLLASLVAVVVCGLLGGTSRGWGDWAVIAMDTPIFGTAYFGALLILPGGRDELKLVYQVVSSGLHRISRRFRSRVPTNASVTDAS